MSDFIATSDRDILARHGLDSFEALWNLQLEAVDAPNTGRGGWSSVFRLDLGDAVRFTVDAGTHAALAELGRTEQATLFMVVHSAFAVLLARLSGSEDIAVGTPIAGLVA